MRSGVCVGRRCGEARLCARLEQLLRLLQLQAREEPAWARPGPGRVCGQDTVSAHALATPRPGPHARTHLVRLKKLGVLALAVSCSLPSSVLPALPNTVVALAPMPPSPTPLMARETPSLVGLLGPLSTPRNAASYSRRASSSSASTLRRYADARAYALAAPAVTASSGFSQGARARGGGGGSRIARARKGVLRMTGGAPSAFQLSALATSRMMNDLRDRGAKARINLDSTKDSQMDAGPIDDVIT